MYTRIRNGAIARDGVRYNVKHVLMRSDLEQPSPGYYSVCGEYTCVLPAHLRVYVKPERSDNCNVCGRAMRPYGVRKEDAPNTISRISGTLCQSCYKAGYNVIGKGERMEELNEVQVRFVTKHVPEDLWSYFGV